MSQTALLTSSSTSSKFHSTHSWYLRFISLFKWTILAARDSDKSTTSLFSTKLQLYIKEDSYLLLTVSAVLSRYLARIWLMNGGSPAYASSSIGILWCHELLLFLNIFSLKRPIVYDRKTGAYFLELRELLASDLMLFFSFHTRYSWKLSSQQDVSTIARKRGSCLIVGFCCTN